jgi:WD40 repeat protein
MTSNLIHHSGCLLTVSLGLFLLTSGCESKPNDKPATQTADNVSAESSFGSETKVVIPGKAAPTIATSTVANQPATVLTTPIVSPQSESAKVRIPSPTVEQIARWKPVPFEPLHLIDIREDEKAGFIANIESAGDGKNFVTSGAKLMKWSIDRNQSPQVMMETPPEDARIIACNVSPKGDYCVVLQKNNWCRIFNLTAGKELVAKQLELKYPERLAISIDAGEIAIFCRNGKLSLWNSNDLTEKVSWEIETGEVSQLEYIRENVLVAAGKTTSSWDMTTGKLLRTFTDKSYHKCAVKSQDAVSWLSLGDDDFIHWRCADDLKLGTVNAGYATNAIIQFSPDAKRLAALNGETIQVWDIASNQVLQTIDHTGKTPVSMAWLPESNLLLVASFDGNLRFWGDAAIASRFGMKALAASPVEASAVSHVPATTAECLAAMDLRNLARFPGTKMPVDHPFQIYGTLPTPAEESRLYYRYLFAQLGWNEVKVGASDEELIFEQNGFRVKASFYSATPQETNVALSHLGNFSADWLPEMEVGNVEIVRRFHTQMTCKVNASLLAIECELLKKLHASGWTAISHLMQRPDDSGDRRDLNFQWNGCHLRVMISQDAEHAGQFDVSFILSPHLNTLPFPTDSGLVEFNDFRELQLIASTHRSLSEATDYFETEMKRHGWLASPAGRKVTDELCWLPFFQGQRDIIIELVKMSNERTLIRAGKYTDSSWQVLPMKTTEDDEEKAADEVGIQAADFPILEASSPVSYEASRYNIRFELDPATDLLTLNEKYIAEFKSLGWSAEPITVATSDSFDMLVKRDSKTLYFRVSRDPAKNINATADSQSFLWTKPIPISDPGMSYINWLKLKRAYATLDRVDEFQREMNELAKK